MSRIARVVALSLILAAPWHAGAQTCAPNIWPAYSHNDYERSRPLIDAVSLGYSGVEADVFLIDGVLRVGHDRRRARRSGTFEELYLSPLRGILANCGRVTRGNVPFLFAVEIKEASPATLDSLLALLQRYPDLLNKARPTTSASPAIAIVLVGWHPAGAIRTPAEGSLHAAAVVRQHRLTRSDTAGLGRLDPQVRLVSVDYGKTIGRWWTTAGQRRAWMAAMRAVKAAAPDRLLRVHNVPPDERIYAALLAAGVDLIGVRELQRTARWMLSHTARTRRSFGDPSP